VIAVGVVLWEQYEAQRAARERFRRVAEPLPVRVPARHRLDVRRRRAA
jgi:signal recognition particle subunit SEC65